MKGNQVIGQNALLLEWVRTISLYINRYKFCNDICNDFVTMNRYDGDRNQETQRKPQKQRDRRKGVGEMEKKVKSSVTWGG